MNPVKGTNLVIDKGNSRVKLALFQGDKVMEDTVWDSLSEQELRSWTYNHLVQNVILSSTADVTDEIEEFLRKEFYFIHLTHQTPLPISIRYHTPETLGRDRIAAAVGAWAEFPQENVLIIDSGTCITMDVVNENGEFLGGNISPGIEMRLKAMHHFTARLPMVQTKGGRIPTKNWLGDSTESAIRNGGELGTLLEVKAFLKYCRRRFHPLKIVFTGGDADFFVKNLKTKIFAHQNLVLVGLNQILQFNVNQSEGFLRS